MTGPVASPPEARACAGADSAAPATLKICVLLPEAETVISALQCAVAAARGFDHEICAVHVGFDSSHALVSAEEMEIQQLRDIYEGSAAARLARVRSAFEAFRAATPGEQAIQWRNDEGDICASIVNEACGANLLVISHPIHMDAADALHSALFDVRRLLLLAPRDAPDQGATIGRHVIVGWKPGDATRRTIEAALPWLRRAEKITVLCVAKTGAEASGADAYRQSARDFFAHLGVDAEIVGLGRDERHVGRQLLDEARERGGDCLLIGAFKHSSLWEALLGGVTRDVLAEAEIPVFMMRS